ncbi:nucleotidyltransferase-like protein [Marinilabilia salmonicolor]|uniref:nucleotidyltransferase family protein n=1 Tax=Marinilabilia salmonicolor TaxID=989 RepID=UPI000D05D88C|nr:sugar phosphate nucleotidyltransferase [Marinilabilia salmonicolor]PRZ00627.1 nucleotidyltransferase-like protein [Marinilabilia salmonicolor]
MKPTLLILAAGMGSRYGGLKQMDELGPNGESIIDYSVFDAIRAGFGKVVFVIRPSFADAFKERFESRLKGKIETEYVFQELENIPAEFSIPEGREKPWGTGHAMLMAKEVINEPFAIINADDFYGHEAYKSAVDFINNNPKENEYAMIGYALKNTLSEHGTVSRGVCETDSKGYLQEVTERTKIGWEDGKVFFYEGDSKTELTGNEPVSMNFWIFKPTFFSELEKGFNRFLAEKGQEMKSEYYFNVRADELIKAGEASTKVIDTDAKWFGVTYQEDKPIVQESLNKLIEKGEYPAKLW